MANKRMTHALFFQIAEHLKSQKAWLTEKRPRYSTVAEAVAKALSVEVTAENVRAVNQVIKLWRPGGVTAIGKSRDRHGRFKSTVDELIKRMDTIEAAMEKLREELKPIRDEAAATSRKLAEDMDELREEITTMTSAFRMATLSPGQSMPQL